jgi:hypothetical protein
MNDSNMTELRLVMRIAVSLIVISLVAVGIADHFNWHELSGAGLTVLGYGGGILQGKGTMQQNNTKTGDIVPGPLDAKK